MATPEDKALKGKKKSSAFIVGEEWAKETKKKRDQIVKRGLKRFLHPTEAQRKKDELDRKYKR